MKKLVIVESPAKAHTVGRILGPDYNVIASVGHIRDLPENKLGIKISADEKHFEPEYVIPDDKTDRVTQIVKAASDADEIFLASDPDREGESIAWHLNEVLRERLGAAYAKKTIRRVEYHEITASAIKAAFAAPHDINVAMVDAQQARRLLDRFVGWKVSPRLKKADIRATAGNSLSAGRVQSVALRIICEREAEIRAFKPVTYWNYVVQLSKKGDSSASFPARLKEFRGKKADGSESEIRDEATAAAAEKFLSSATYAVSDISTSSEVSKPYPPFKTSTMQQAASNVLHYSPETTMRLAQGLYEAGLITYIRSDAPTVSKFAQDAAEAFVCSTWGKEYSAPNGYVTKKEKGQQQAHECIRPTDVNARPGSVQITLREADQAARLYDLIWKQFVKSQMKPAIYDRLTVSISATDGSADSARLSAGTRTLAFPGFLQADPAKLRAAKNGSEEKEEGDDDDSVASMPALAEGEALDRDAVDSERKETKPPARYNEASIVRKLEESGIGRPSTYAAVVKTLKDRKYVTSANRVLKPTEVGEKVVDYLVKIDSRCAARENGFPGLFYVEYTSRMESELDKVADEVGHRDVDWQSMLAEFYANLGKWLDTTNSSADPAAVRAVLAKFNEVKEWRPARKVRSRAYDDKRFVQDIAFDVQGITGKEAKALRDTPYSFDPNRMAAEAASVTERQLVYLVRILSEYESQIPGLKEFVLALADSYRAGDSDPDVAEIRAKLREPFSADVSSACDAQKKIFAAVPNGVCEGDSAFFNSLAEQVASGKSLSSKQMYYLGRMFVAAGHEGLIPGFSPELCAELGIQWTEKPAQVDPERAGALIAALGSLEEWDAPAGGGKKGRKFDDRDFFASVSAQFGVKRRISEKQLAALERMLLHYKAKILGADELIAKYGIVEKPRKRAFGGKKSKKA